MIDKAQRTGGIVAIAEGIIYVFGFALFFTFMNPLADEAKSSLEKLMFIIENKTIFQVWILTIYVVFGILLVPLTIAIYENFKEPSLIGKATPIFGFIWSGLVISSGMIANIGIDAVAKMFVTDQNQALTSWQTIEAIQNGLGGGVEVVGGLWVLLISITAIQQTVFSRFLNYLGLVVGAAGILTIIPGLKDLGAIFGLLQIVWFIWIGIEMIRNKNNSR